MKTPRVVLLGPNGQLGSDIREANARLAKPLEILPIGRDRVDVASSATLEQQLASLRFDILANCTGYHNTDAAEDNANLAFAVNAHAVRAMARLCGRRGARFLHISTDYVFGGDRTRRKPLTEEDAIAPINVYGASKAMGEALAAGEASTLGELENVLVFRVASLFGVTGASAKGGNFVETMIRVGETRGRLTVVDDQIMSPTATADVAQVALRAFADWRSGVYHVVNSGTASWFEFATEIVRRAGVRAEVAPCSSADYPTRAMRPPYSALDDAKLAADFGRLPPWSDALDRYLRARGRGGS